MKQLLFLLLFPCLALAQYQGNANQKITLGEQTTADGLVWRGRLADTANLLTNKLDTSVYIVLDTGTRAMWYYRVSTTPKWTRLVDSLNNLQGQLSLTTKVTGVLPVVNGGTGSSTLAGANIVTGSGTTNYLPKFTGASSIGNSVIYDNSGNIGIGFTSTFGKLSINVNAAAPASSGNMTNGLTVANTNGGRAINFGINEAGAYSYIQSAYVNNADVGVNLAFFIGDQQRMFLNTSGNVGIGTIDPTEKLHVVGNARITAVGALGGNSATLYRNSDGVLSTTSSDINKKHNVRPIMYGLSTINQLNPVNFQWNVDESEDIGFIAQDIQNIIPESIETDWDSNLIFKYEKLIPILTKAIQEQQALIKALEQRILNLENK